MVGHTPAVKVLLEDNTLDRELFCALVAEHVVQKASEYDQEGFRSFPVPYRVVEKVVRDLFGEEESDAIDKDIEELMR